MAGGTHIDILDSPEPLRGSFFGSMILHGIMGAVIAIAAIWQSDTRDTFGDPNAISGGTPITPVATIPMINQTSRVNPVANDTESLVPQRTQPPKPEPDEEDAVRLGKKDQKKKKKSSLDLAAYLKARNKAFDELKENQSGSTTGAQASSPMFGKPGTGGVGLGDGNPFGNRFGGYAALLRDCVVRKWNTSEVDSNLRTAPTVVVAFQILRNGATQNLRILQRSGNTALDYSCQRAIVDCSPFPPLPNEFERNSAIIEFQFLLKR